MMQTSPQAMRNQAGVQYAPLSGGRLQSLGEHGYACLRAVFLAVNAALGNLREASSAAARAGGRPPRQDVVGRRIRFKRPGGDAAWLEAGSNDFVGDAARRGRPDVLLRADSAAEWS